MIHPRLVAELRDLRIANDRLRVEKGAALARVEELEEEIEALREFAAMLAKAGA